jgi:hypothetical protein
MSVTWVTSDARYIANSHNCFNFAITLIGWIVTVARQRILCYPLRLSIGTIAAGKSAWSPRAAETSRSTDSMRTTSALTC